MAGPDIQLITPDSAEHWQETRLILREYANSLDVDLDFQGFEDELAGLPGAADPASVPICGKSALVSASPSHSTAARNSAFWS
mgnify:CR=1 FL=1